MVTPPINPYAPPRAVDDAPVALAFGDFDIARSLTDAWEACKRHFPLWLGVLFVGGLLMLLSALTIIGYFVVVPVFAWGIVKFMLNMVDGQPSFDDLFAGFKNYFPLLGRVLLLTLIIIVISVLSESLVFVGQYTKSTPIIVLGYVVYAAFAFTVTLRLYFAFFLVVDQNLGALDALGASWRMTQGKTGKVIGLALLSSLVAVSGIVACGVGIVWTSTMAWVMYASAYRQIVGPKGQPTALRPGY